MLFIFNTINLIKDIGILENSVRPGERESKIQFMLYILMTPTFIKMTYFET